MCVGGWAGVCVFESVCLCLRERERERVHVNREKEHCGGLVTERESQCSHQSKQ